jgi:membrane protease YdiL (CAAX protease family)
LCLVAHEITAHIDLKVAMRTRKVSAFEQQVHSILEMMPLTALFLLCILHWPQTLSLLGMGPQKADFSLTTKQAPLWDALIPTFLAFGLLVFLPYAEELWRGFRAEARHRAAEPPSARF